MAGIAGGKKQTFMSNVHLGLEFFELFGVSGLGLGSHLLASPLHGTVDLACEVHDVVISVESSNLREVVDKGIEGAGLFNSQFPEKRF